MSDDGTGAHGIDGRVPVETCGHRRIEGEGVHMHDVLELSDDHPQARD